MSDLELREILKGLVDSHERKRINLGKYDLIDVIYYDKPTKEGFPSGYFVRRLNKAFEYPLQMLNGLSLDSACGVIMGWLDEE